MARPLKEVDTEQLEKLAGFGLSVGEIASVLGCSPDTLQRRYADVMESGRQRRNASLKRRQFELAMDGHPTMLIWLGKQFLGQTDKAALEHSTPEGRALAPPVFQINFVKPGEEDNV